VGVRQFAGRDVRAWVREWISESAACPRVGARGGGALGSVKDLGASIVEMQQHVDGRQKDLATFKKVEAALGGGTEGGTS